MLVQNQAALSKPSGVLSLTPVSLLLTPLGITAFLWATRTNAVTPEGVLYAFFLLLVPWGSFLVWRQQKDGGLPIFALLGFAYWWYFSIGLFWLDRVLYLVRLGTVDTESVIAAMRLALVGVVCLWAGMKVPLAFLTPSRQPDLSIHPTTWVYVRLVLVAGTMAKLTNGSTNVLGAEGRQIMEILVSTVPTVALLLILGRCFNGQGLKVDHVLLWIYFPVMIAGGLASGWLGSVITLGLISGAMYFTIRGRVPVTMIVVAIGAVLFLQVGKKDFRNLYWDQGEEAGILEKATFWINGSASQWSEAINGRGFDSTHGLSSQSLERTSLITQVAHVLDVTPSQVPFQDGRTYRFVLVSLIPRFIWPDKPTVSEANQYYQVAFGLNSEKDVNQVNIGVGCLAEAYMNFGWPGVIGIMFAIGLILGVYERSFIAPTSSSLFLAIGIALLPGLVGIESQMAAYLGGVIQTVLLTIVVFLPVVRRRGERVETWQKSFGEGRATRPMRVRANP